MLLNFGENWLQATWETSSDSRSNVWKFSQITIKRYYI